MTALLNFVCSVAVQYTLMRGGAGLRGALAALIAAVAVLGGVLCVLAGALIYVVLLALVATFFAYCAWLIFARPKTELQAEREGLHIRWPWPQQARLYAWDAISPFSVRGDMLWFDVLETRPSWSGQRTGRWIPQFYLSEPAQTLSAQLNQRRNRFTAETQQQQQQQQ